MKFIKFVILALSLFGLNYAANAQCNHTLTIHSSSAECNGDGTSTVTINVSILFGNGNNSAVISYNIGAGEVNAEVLNKSDGDVIETTYMFNVPSCDDYIVSLTGWTNPAGSGSSCAGAQSTSIILPVEFGTFSVNTKGGSVELNWTTLSETNNDKFVIERASDNYDFEYIGEVKGSINSVELKSYRFIDESDMTGVYYYRIKQIDLDGAYSYSDLRSIKIDPKSSLLAYPNPAYDFITISTQAGNTYQIVDTRNRVVGTIKASEDKISYDISLLNSGMYFIIGLETLEHTRFIKR